MLGIKIKPILNSELTSLLENVENRQYLAQKSGWQKQKYATVFELLNNRVEDLAINIAALLMWEIKNAQ